MWRVEYNLTPSSDCESKAELAYTGLMETLLLTRQMNLLALAEEPTKEEQENKCVVFSENFSYVWGDDVFEDSSYEPLMNYLEKYLLNPRNISRI